MRFRPCIDIHNGKVKQIVGGSLTDDGDFADENFVSEQDAAYFADLYKKMGLKGGHIIILNSAGSQYYDASVAQAIRALRRTPGLLQIGGGINADNAAGFLDAGASHVIVTSYVFSGGRINYDNLDELVKRVGRERLVLDLSCRERGDSYFIVTDRWQKETDVEVNEATLSELSSYCDEFLIHAVDVEGQQNGIETSLAGILGSWAGIPMTYAGGIRSLEDILRIKEFGHGHMDFTVGSALDIFGGALKLEDVIGIK